MDGSILLNNENMPDASAEFKTIPDSDELTLVLYGVHPCDDIEVAVKTVTDDDGNIRFSGIQLIDNVGSIKVEGLYNCSHEGMEDIAKPSVGIDITYMMPNISYISMTIPFDDISGFRYVRDPGVYPKDTVDNEAIQDSCELICQDINSELQKNLKSMSFAFDDGGKMTLSYITRDLYKYSQRFRYWVKTEKSTGKKIIEFENADQFYQMIFHAMNLDITDDIIEFTHSLPYNMGRFHIEKEDSELSGIIIFLDDIHYKIFHYLNSQFSEKGIWDNTQKNYIDLIYTITKDRFNQSPDEMLKFSSYRWALKKFD
ncbi:MAG: hypothetical protein NC453_16555 [Muribaculum sp.]|nr:hypothetical protein [Muribaculum sp.]